MNPHVGCNGSIYRFVSQEGAAKPNPDARLARIASEIVLQAACAMAVLAIVGSVLVK